ncbi:hypothetical protein CR970_02820 [Candidatus Saccharibacteria bacterium]|nr:MAG: hypothetical protein CR970_02820 [Candidatus Saccharibacteria bacterium]
MKRYSRREIAKSIARQIHEGADPQVLMRQAAAYVVRHKMAAQADLLVQDVSDELSALTGTVYATATVAVDPTKQLQSQLRDFIKQQTGAHAVDLEIARDEELVGGVVVRVAGQELDTSVRRKLRQLTAPTGGTN